MNVEFDEDNGSQAKQIIPSVVGDEAPSQVIRTMRIGHILPQETSQVQVSEEGASAPLVDSPQGKSSSPPQVQDASGAQAPIQEQDEAPHVTEQDQGQAQPNGDEPNLEAQDQAQDRGQDQVKEVASPKAKQVRASSRRIQPSEEELEKKRQKVELRLQMLQHFTNNILGSINIGLTTRKRLANFCKHHSFALVLSPSR